MALTKINKNKMLENFFAAVAEGCNFHEAAKNAGFSHPERDVARELHNPDFLPAMANAIRHRLGGRLAMKAMGVAEELLNDKRTNPRIRWDIAKTLLAAGVGFVPPKAKEMDDAPRDIHQMTGDEIMRFREAASAEMLRRAEGAKLIEHQPQSYANLD